MFFSGGEGSLPSPPEFWCIRRFIRHLRMLRESTRQHHQHQADVFLKRVLLLCAPFTNTQAVAMSDRDGTSAWRRRQRRLRAQWRHEQQTGAVALAAALHHSAGPKVEMQQNAALRGLNTGTRAEGEDVYEQYHDPRGQKTPLFRGAAWQSLRRRATAE